VKPDSTALWSSKILPWSDMLTGNIGEYPGYDPLQFMLDEAHKRGMKVHAWFNPIAYRPTPTVNHCRAEPPSLNPSSSCAAPDGCVLWRSFVLDPGIPEVRDWITQMSAKWWQLPDRRRAV
jgi:uncharacterized lipoprotein YddW (UPF0748 family)